MELKELIALAIKRDPEFKNKYIYWTETRRRTPDIRWLMDKLEETLGRDFCRQAAEDMIGKEIDKGEYDQKGHRGQ